MSHFPEHRKIEWFLKIGCFSGLQGSGEVQSYQWLNKTQLYYLTLLEVRNLAWVSQVKDMVLAGLSFLLRLQGRICSQLVERGCCIPCSLQNQQWMAEFSSHCISDTDPPALLFHLDDLGQPFNFNISGLVTLIQSTTLILLCHTVTYFQGLGCNNLDIFGGHIFCLALYISWIMYGRLQKDLSYQIWLFE